ncbi:MAG: DUF1003 domain-containing protein [Candidatus Eremiobacteraeota bacterium]|nr:DUF1003 domain-containing protein [Candidatus Eremiobacteraeota bacterium]
MNASANVNAAVDPTDHPLVHDVNKEHADSLSPVEKGCKKIADWTGSPLALGLAIVIQAIWIPVGLITKLDPYPFAFLLTCSNVLQLILIFILAVGQRQSSSHAELRAEHDHDSISRLLYHQEVQEQVLLALARKIGIEVEGVATMVKALASEDG